MIGSGTSQLYAEQVRSGASAFESKLLNNTFTTIPDHQALVNIFLKNFTKACMSLALLALHFVQTHDPGMLSMAPLLVVLREEGVERDWEP